MKNFQSEEFPLLVLQTFVFGLRANGNGGAYPKLQATGIDRNASANSERFLKRGERGNDRGSSRESQQVFTGRLRCLRNQVSKARIFLERSHANTFFRWTDRV